MHLYNWNSMTWLRDTIQEGGKESSCHASVRVSSRLECLGYQRDCSWESDENYPSWTEFPFQKSLGGASATMMGSEQATHCILIIHFGIAVVQNGLLFRFLLSALVSLHSHTLSLAGIISWLSKVCASDIFSFLSECFIDSMGISHPDSLNMKEIFF